MVILQHLLNSPSGTMIAITFGALVLVTLYFIPALLAFAMGHPHPVLLLLANGLFGWTLIGWIVVLVWALWQSRDPDNFDDFHNQRKEPFVDDFDNFHNQRKEPFIADL